MYIIASRLKLQQVGADRKLSVGTPPRIHELNYDAVQEACRLAQENPTKEFLVFKAVAQASVTPPPPPPVELKEL